MPPVSETEFRPAHGLEVPLNSRARGAAARSVKILALPAQRVLRGDAVVSENFLPMFLGRGDFEPGFSHVPLDSPAGRRLYPEGQGAAVAHRGALHGFLETVGLLCGGPEWGSYWHFLLDYLPRLLLIDRVARGLPLLVNAGLTPIQREILHHYAGGRRLVCKPDGEGIRCTDLVAPAFLTATGAVSPEVPAFLRSAQASVSPEPTGRLYLSRRGVANRPLAGEADLEAAMEAAGFTVIRCHDLSFRDQMECLAGAKVIVGAHGGHFANVAFAQPGARVVEIETKPGHTGPACLSAASGHDHWIVPADATAAEILETALE